MPLTAARRVFLGLLLMGTGIAMLAGRLSGTGGGALTARIWELWPLILVVAGLIRLVFFVDHPWELIRPAAIVLGGSLLLAAHQLVAWQVPFSGGHYSSLLWPSTVILAGCWIALIGHGQMGRTSPPLVLDELVWLRGDKVRPTDVSGDGRIRVVLGYLRLDLKQMAKGKDRLILDITVVLGHVQIQVPEPVKFDEHLAFVLGSRGLRYNLPPGERPHSARLVVNVIGILGEVVVEPIPRGVHTGDASSLEP
jgi:hypothetical protein